MRTKWMIAAVALLLANSVLYAQKQDERLASAQYWESKGKIESAALYYKDYLNLYPRSDAALYYKTAGLMLSLFHYTDAETYFTHVVNSDSLPFYPDALFWLAMVKKNKAEYQQAAAVFRRYKEEFAQTNRLLKTRAEHEMEACKKAMEIRSKTLPIMIEILNSNINTAHSEFNAVNVKNAFLFFSATRPLTDDSHAEILESFITTQIYTAPYDFYGAAKGKSISPKINNVRYHNSKFCFDAEKGILYFTRLRVRQDKKDYETIYFSRNVGGKWSVPEPLGEIINAPKSNNSSPWVTKIGKNQVLFFCSDRAGGQGGIDIWYSVFDAGTWTHPANLGSNINTIGNEICPFYHDGTLYFSSDWHAGLGGYDIFASKGALGGWETPRNVGYPLNSEANDIYFTINADGKSGYLTSNRKSDSTLTDETCCNNIYEYQYFSENIAICRDTFRISDAPVIEQNIRRILPITLYFHNDEPNPNSTAASTQSNYFSTLLDYFALKDVYKKAYSKGLTGKEKEKAIADIDTFFTNEVAGGFARLQLFSKWLLTDLKQGNDVNVTVMGFASPLFTDDYNANLSSRRISSLVNYIVSQPEFAPYLDTSKAGNKLSFTAEPRGKKDAATYVSDNPNDVRNSIYSIAAAMERRIQILEYKSVINENRNVPLPRFAIDSIYKILSPEYTQYEFWIEVVNQGESVWTIHDLKTDVAWAKVDTDKKELNAAESTYVRILANPKKINKTIECRISIIDNSHKTTHEIKCFFGN